MKTPTEGTGEKAFPDTPVFLVNPPIEPTQKKGRKGAVIKNLFFNSPPLGIASIAAYLETIDIPVKLMDAAVEGFTLRETVNRILTENPSIVGLTSCTTFFVNALTLAEKLKETRRDLTVVIGGPHVSGSAESVMKYRCFDFACIGEGEITMAELVTALSDGTPISGVKGIAMRKEGRVIFTEPRPLIEDLDILPFPARHLLPMEKYVPQPNDGPYLPKLSMITSRGCPYKCIFCDHSTYGFSYRSRSAKLIVDEMEHLVETYGAKDIAFVDSLFMVTVSRVESIVDEILSRGVKVHWTCTIRANIATEEILAKMKDAGCWRVRIGIEAGTPHVLRFIRKQITREQVEKVTEAADTLGLHPKGFFMIGHPTETAEDIEESIRFACSLPLTDITVQINTPVPGAEQWHMAKDYGEIITNTLENYSFWEPVFIPEGLTRKQLESLYRKFYRSFYLRPVIFLRQLKMMKRGTDLKRFVRAAKLLFSLLLGK